MFLYVSEDTATLICFHGFNLDFLTLLMEEASKESSSCQIFIKAFGYATLEIALMPSKKPFV